jgi:superoxide reductase
MTSVGELYVCKICGNTVEVVAAGAGRLVCCGQPMEVIGNANEDEEET